MNFIRNRTDVSEWLIHFVRDRDPDNDFPGGEENYGRLVGKRLAPDASAFDVLKEILRVGALLPGYSFRNGRTTIYGGKPAICFTEAPVYDFVKYVSERNQLNRCSPYGICLLKKEVFSASGRPAIYGLTTGQPALIEDSKQTRIIDPKVLPIAEQFRYIAYDPTREKPLDFSHEREWRWVATKGDTHRIWYDAPNDFDMYEALPIFRERVEGGYFSHIRIVVWTRSEAKEVSELILRYIDTGYNDFGEQYSLQVLQDSFVIPLEEVESRKIYRIEDAPNDLKIVAQRKLASFEMINRVKKHIVEATNIANNAAREFIARAQKTKDGHVADFCGGAWIVTYDITSDVTDALLKSDLAEPMANKYYKVEVEFDTGGEQALSVHEAAAKAAAEYLAQMLGQEFFVHPWWD